MNNLIILLVVIPLLGAGICLIEKFFHRWPLAQIASISAVIGTMSVVAVLYPAIQDGGQLVYTVGGWSAIIGIQQWFDGLSWLSFAFMLFVALMVLLYAIAEQRYEYTFYFVFLVMLAGAAGALLAADLFNLFVCLEIMGIASYILIAYLPKGAALVASFQYLVLSSFGMAFFLLGIFVLYQHTGTLAFFDMGRIVAAAEPGSPQIAIAVAALVVGLGVRTAFFRFHTWLPDAHAAAPHPVSAMLSGILLKISFLSIWRLVIVFDMHALQTLLLWLGAVTALGGVCLALAQSDCKKLLAWHSISQMGYILAGFGVGTPLGLTASFLHTINHGVFKSLLFLSVGSVIHVTGQRNLKRLGGLAVRLPILMAMFLAGALSIAGIPPFNGFISKKLLLYSAKELPIISAALWLAGVGTVASFTKLSGMFWKPANFSDNSSQPPQRLPSLTYLPLLLLSVFCLLTGIFGQTTQRWVGALLFGSSFHPSASLYSLKNLLDTLVTVGLGIALYRLVISAKGHHVTTVISQRYVGLDRALLWLVIGFIGLAVFAML